MWKWSKNILKISIKYQYSPYLHCKIDPCLDFNSIQKSHIMQCFTKFLIFALSLDERISLINSFWNECDENSAYNKLIKLFIRDQTGRNHR